MKTLHNALTAIALLITLAATATAQEQPKPVFGYISYATVFQQMPEYDEAQQNFQKLKAMYDAEAARAEEEFQRKFSEFLQGQKEFPQSIMRKRQTELQELMEQGVEFRTKAQQLLAEAQAELQKPVEQKLTAAINAVAARQRLIFVINTDNHACPYIDPTAGTDLYEPVLAELGLASSLDRKQQ